MYLTTFSYVLIYIRRESETDEKTLIQISSNII